MDKFLGLQYPLEKTSRGILAQKRNVDQIKADMLQLLLTNPGERCMLPEFGTPLRKLIFEPNDGALVNEATRIIGESLARWEPRVEITNVQVTSNFDPNDLNREDIKDDLEHILGIKIEFVDPQNISKVESLVMQLPVG